MIQRISDWFFETPPSFELQVIIMVLLVVICGMLAFLMYKGWRREQEAIRREKEAVAREEAFQLFQAKVVKHFADVKVYFDQSSILLEMTKVYADLARTNNKDAKHAAESTRQVIHATASELHQIGEQAVANAAIVVEKAEELKTVIPELTVQKLSESGSGVFTKNKTTG